MEKLIKKTILKYEIEILTGIHVGGSKENVEIGGIDNPVIKCAMKDNQPYIPGSSLKGKIRCLLEQIAGKPNIGGSQEVNKLFGFSDDKLPSKIIVRDAFLKVGEAERLKNCDNLDMPYTENKFENTIDRIRGVTKNGGVRQTERVPAGTFFDLEIVINVWDNNSDGDKSIELLEKGIKALENDYLGGSGSRGYGQVKLHKISENTVSFENYFEQR